MDDKISLSKWFLIFLVKIFQNGIIKIIINTILPILISLYSITYSKDEFTIQWIMPIITLVSIIVIFNAVSEFMLYFQKKKDFRSELVNKCYSNQNVLNTSIATKLFRLNKSIEKTLTTKNINSNIFDKIADFNTIAFDVCNAIFNILTSEYNIKNRCDVQLFVSQNKFITMKAFANQYGITPKEYGKMYKQDLRNHKFLFVHLMDGERITPFCINNKKYIDREYLEFSKTHEYIVSQYIGIPILTCNRDVILLQVKCEDKNVFGKRNKELLGLAENVLRPYISLLYKTYERDIICNGYYSLIAKYSEE